MNVRKGDWVLSSTKGKVQGRVVQVDYRREPAGCENIGGKLVTKTKGAHYVRLKNRRWGFFIMLPVEWCRVIRKGKR